MANPPYSGAVLIIRENQDGFVCEIYHWDDLADGVPVPPRANISGALAARANDPNSPAFYKLRTATSKSDLITKFTQYINAKFPDSP